MSNMKMVSLIDAEAAEAKAEARADLEHAASAIADELLQIRSTVEALQAVLGSAQRMISELRRDVDELMKPL